jgi:uncharacterized protein YsxB (DUF464 family)
VQVRKVNGNYSQLKVEGHASKAFGLPGKNILCSAVSALAQSLFIFLDKRGLVEKYSVKSGRLFVEAKQSESVNPAFEFLLGGIEVLKHQYPAEFQFSEETL